MAALMSVIAQPVQAAPPPTGFVLRTLQTGVGFGEYLTDFAFLPDSSVLTAVKGGQLYWAPPVGEPRLLAELDVRTDEDHGLIGISPSPNFRTDRQLYTARGIHSTGPGSGAYGTFRLSAWTVTVDADGNPTGLTDERVLFDASADDRAHGMTTVLAAEDGTLWISIGDSAAYEAVDLDALRAQDLDDPHGKILHIEVDGSGVETNPFFQPQAPDSWRSRVWASGFRSPFRLTLHPTSGVPVVGDVGWSEHEEVDLVQRGGNYGWPCWEGNVRTTGYRELPQCAGVSTVAPVWTYPRTQGNSVTGGVIYTGTTYPEAYRGAYFFGDFAVGMMWTMVFYGQGQLAREPEPAGFATGLGGPTRFATAPNGDIAYGSLHNGVVQRLVYEPGNNAPAANIQVTNNPATRTVSFDGTGSVDPNGDPLTYRWDFGDGTHATGATAQHTYAASPAGFTARLTVTDPLAASGSTQLAVSPGNHAPSLTLTPPPAGRTFAVGDLVTASASATDVEDGSSVAQSLRWTSTLVHCRELACHDHPGAGQSGPNFSTVFDGHPGDTRLVITVTATDSRGATTRRSFEATPRQRRLTVRGEVPADLLLGDVRSSSSEFTVGQRVTIVAPEVALDGVSTFAGWGDGGPRIREVTIGDEDRTLDLTYLGPIDRRYQDDTALRTALGAPTGVEQIGQGLRWRTYANGRMYWTPQQGITEVHGGIAATFEAHNAHVDFGVPTNEESGTPDGRGRYNHFTGGRSIYWTATTGARTVLGGIRAKWESAGAHAGMLGYPSTNETVLADRVGAFNDFEHNASIYWTAATDARIVRAGNRAKWNGLGGYAGFLRYPVTDEALTTEGTGTFQRFQGGSIYYSNATGSWSVRAGIEAKWLGLGAERGFLRYPTTDETSTQDGTGAYNRFQNGAVYYHPVAGIHEVHGGIYQRWAQLGAERSYLGYPTSDEYPVPGGARSNFTNGYIVWLVNGQVYDRRY